MKSLASVRHLFDADDNAGFPDIVLENLIEEEILIVFHLIMSFCGSHHDQRVYSFERGTNVAIEETIHPEREFSTGRFEDFSHKLSGININGTVLYDLDIYIEDDLLAFDYHPGDDWNEERVIALFCLLSLVKKRIPNARINHYEEGCRHKPHPEFSKALDAFISKNS